VPLAPDNRYGRRRNGCVRSWRHGLYEETGAAQYSRDVPVTRDLRRTNGIPMEQWIWCARKNGWTAAEAANRMLE